MVPPSSLFEVQPSYIYPELCNHRKITLYLVFCDVTLESPWQVERNMEVSSKGVDKEYGILDIIKYILAIKFTYMINDN
jgi:hypothetical protein